MDPIASFSGLASGVQWRDLIDQIIQVERRPAVLVEQQITGIQSKSATWLSFQNKLTSFQDAVQGLADGSSFKKYTNSIYGSGFTASTGSDVAPGSYSVEVLGLAAAEKLGGDVVASTSTALGQSGEFWINGSRIEIAAGDTLSDVAYAINAANTGSSATGVTASVLGAGGGYQVVLTSRTTGAAGIDVVDGADGVAAGLGLTDGQLAIKHGTSDGATSDAFASRTLGVAALRGLTGTSTGHVTLGSGTGVFSVDIDLTKGLDQIAADIQSAATAAGSGVTASVVTETVDGKTTYRLDIGGTTTLSDDGGVLQALGVLEGGRSTVTQEITSGGTLKASGSPATGTADLVALDTPATLGDTFTVGGTKPDGTTFSMTLTVAAVSDPANGDVKTLDDVLAALNGAKGFDGAATASLVDGQIVVKDAAGGSSQLDLSMVSHNEGGGTLDFGDFDVTSVGRRREIVAGSDAAVRIDGVYSTHGTNSVSNPIPGVTLSLSAVTTEPGVLTISRNTESVVSAVKSLVSTYNEISTFVTGQFTGGAGSTKPLAGDATLRSMMSQVRTTMQATLTTGVGGSWSRLGELGIQIQRDGTFQLTESTFRDAFASDPSAVERLFGEYGSTSGSGLSYLHGADATVAGTYTVAVTTPATMATVLGSTALADGFDAAADTLTITDLGSGKSYAVDLSNGESAATVLANIQAALATPQAHVVSTATALATDASGTAATGDTTWSEIFQAGSSAGVADGDSITTSGRRADGTSFYKSLQITDATTQTVGELKDLVQNAVGTGAIVSIGADGKITVTTDPPGSSLLEVTISASNDGGGSLSLSTEVTQEGREAASIDATLEGGALRLGHQDYGSAAGFRVEFGNAATGTELGLGASGTEYAGTDVEGTIGGLAATGSGRVLTGASDTDVEGLSIQVTDAFTSGSVTFSRGIASQLDAMLESLLGTDDGSLQSILDALDGRVNKLNDRVDALDARLVRRQEELVRRFTAMEQAMAVAQSQSAWIASQVGSLPTYSSSSS